MTSKVWIVFERYMYYNLPEYVRGVFRSEEEANSFIDKMKKEIEQDCTRRKATRRKNMWIVRDYDICGGIDNLELISRERQRQIEEKNFTKEHDDKYINNELTLAAISYAFHGTNLKIYEKIDHEDGITFIDPFPFALAFDSGGNHSHKDNLIKAAALLLAEIDRLDRKEDKIIK